MGSEESHFNVSVGSDNKVTGQRPQTTAFLKWKESWKGTEVVPLISLTNALPGKKKKKETVRNSWTVLKVILGREYHHNH